jgi:hypothetical protein
MSGKVRLENLMVNELDVAMMTRAIMISCGKGGDFSGWWKLDRK